MKNDLTRRQFLKMAGTGLAIAVVSTSDGFRLLSPAQAAEEPISFQPNAWINPAEQHRYRGGEQVGDGPGRIHIAAHDRRR
jgi:hypothetical protein